VASIIRATDLLIVPIPELVSLVILFMAASLPERICARKLQLSTWMSSREYPTRGCIALF
jgi:hypothetical protein